MTQPFELARVDVPVSTRATPSDVIVNATVTPDVRSS